MKFYNISRRTVFAATVVFLCATFFSTGSRAADYRLFDRLGFEAAAGGVAQRISSASPDTNNDYIMIAPGKSATIADIKGAGLITHIWMTLLCADPMWPQAMVLEMYWDGETQPSVRVPLGDFFGLVFGKRREFSSATVSVTPHRATGLNSSWPMPFAGGAKIVVKNESALPVQAFYFQIDYLKLSVPLAAKKRFAAGYRRAQAKNYVEQMQRFETVRATGSGCLAGYFFGIVNTDGGWFGEGDEIIETEHGRMQSTGLEDAIGGAWRPVDFYAAPQMGYLPDAKAADNWKGVHAAYRYYLDTPVCYEKNLTLAFEKRPEDEWSATIFFYREGSLDFGEFPSPSIRNRPLDEKSDKSIREIGRLFIEIYRLSGWPDKFVSFDIVGDIIARVDEFVEKEDYESALRILRAAARE